MVGDIFGWVWMMINENGWWIKDVILLMLVEIIGFNGVLEVGDYFVVFDDEKMVWVVGEEWVKWVEDEKWCCISYVILDNFFDMMKKGEMKFLLIIIKVDV